MQIKIEENSSVVNTEQQKAEGDEIDQEEEKKEEISDELKQ